MIPQDNNDLHRLYECTLSNAIASEYFPNVTNILIFGHVSYIPDILICFIPVLINFDINVIHEMDT